MREREYCPGRPVISVCDTLTEKISAFVDQKAQPLVPEIKLHIKDTNDSLHKLEEIGELPDEAILCTIDVFGLYPHILHKEGFKPRFFEKMRGLNTFQRNLPVSYSR